jgi:hypothetical protein
MPPRPTVIGTLFLFISVSSLFLLLRLVVATLPDYSSAFGPCRSLSARLADEDARYSVFLQERLELIEKWGPKVNAINP